LAFSFAPIEPFFKEISIHVRPVQSTHGDVHLLGEVYRRVCGISSAKVHGDENDTTL
jgi:hypothetical protein